MRDSNYRDRKAHSAFTGSNRLRRWCTVLLAYCMLIYGMTPMTVNAQVSGNISPNSIEIDNAANLFFGNGVDVKNPGPNLVDWVRDTDPNTDPTSYIDGVANGLIFGTTAATGGTGHWNGVRIVDKTVNGTDQDIFLSGGKVNVPSSWNIGPGTVGSSKYDATQAFLANNISQLFFGMQRSGNNGTTAFDFEFDQLAPLQLPPGNTNQGYVPHRTDGDILISFELQGSGGDSGSVRTYVFRHDGTNFVNFCDDDPATTGTGQGVCAGPLLTSINAEGTAQEPWGYVDSHGAWVLGPSLSRRLFAEAQVPLSLLPGVNTCGGTAYVQIRTRASSSLGSDAKDTTKFFQYNFGGPNASGALTTGCGLNIHYDGSQSTTSGSSGASLSYSWQFQKNSNADGSGTWSNSGSPVTGVSGDFTAPSAGRYRAILTITENGACMDDVTTNEVNVNTTVGGTASLTADCDDTFTYSAAGTGGSGSYAYEWTIYKENGATDLVAKTGVTGASGTLDIDDFNAGANGPGQYYAIVRIKDANNPTCFFDVTTNAIDVRYLLTASATKTSSTANVNQADGSFSVLATGSTNASATDTIPVVKQWQQFTGGAWADVGGNSATLTRTMSEIISLGSSEVNPTLVTILSDPYSVTRSSLRLRFKATQTLNTIACPATSSEIVVRAIKAVDP